MKGLKGKRVTVLGLGLLGGGVATTSWLIDQGARVTVTDLKDAKQLASSVRRVEEYLKKSARDGRDYEKKRARLAWSLGGHSDKLIDAADIVVVNPDISADNLYVQRAVQKGKQVMNEGTLFYDAWPKKAVGITGTRGKTTTTSWAHHFIAGSLLAGNSNKQPFQSAMTQRASVAVTELSSFILELFKYAGRGPNIAVITNLYRDHLNRHKTMENYAETKAEIFRYHSAKDVLILNADDAWTPWFLQRAAKSQVRFFSLKPLRAGQEGVWFQDNAIWERESDRMKGVLNVPGFLEKWGEHNLANLLAAALAARMAGVSWAKIQPCVATLPTIPLRQETIYQDKTMQVINDTTATSPEGGIAAVKRWGGPNCILIAGGTDRELDFQDWAKVVQERLRPTNLVFLDGSATQKMRKALGSWARGVRSYATLANAWRAAQKRSRLFVSSVILFSPAAKSFELFQNEFDRGEQFSALVK